MHLVAVDCDFHVRRVEAMLLELLVQRVGRRRLRLTGAEQLLSGAFDETDQSHEFVLLTPPAPAGLGLKKGAHSGPGRS